MDNRIADAALRLAARAQKVDQESFFSPLAAEELDSLKARFDLSPEMIAWYQTAAPRDFEIPVFGNRPLLYDPSQLAEAQAGYSYDAVSGDKLPDWDDSWIVFGGDGPYPLIVKASGAADGAVYYAEAGSQSWELKPLSADLEGFLLGLSEYIELYTSKYNNTICDDNSVLLSSFYDDFTALLDAYPSTSGLGDRWLHGWLGV